MEAFKQMLSELITSKKFMAMIVGLVVALGARYGLNLDPDMVNVVLGIIGVYILAQGVADHKKEAAKIESVTATALGKPPSPGAKKAAKKIAENVEAKEIK